MACKKIVLASLKKLKNQLNVCEEQITEIYAVSETLSGEYNNPEILAASQQLINTAYIFSGAIKYYEIKLQRLEAAKGRG